MNTHAEDGFTLIEVLIAAVVIATCLLGLLGLQTASMQRTHDTKMALLARTATLDMAARIRANPASSAAGVYGAIRPGSASNPGVDCMTHHCSPAQMARYDAWEWQQSLAAQLPHGQGAVQCIAFSTNSCANYTITVLWQGNHRRTVSAAHCGDRLNGMGTRTQCHTLEIRP